MHAVTLQPTMPVNTTITRLFVISRGFSGVWLAHLFGLETKTRKLSYQDLRGSYWQFIYVVLHNHSVLLILFKNHISRLNITSYSTSKPSLLYIISCHIIYNSNWYVYKSNFSPSNKHDIYVLISCKHQHHKLLTMKITCLMFEWTTP